MTFTIPIRTSNPNNSRQCWRRDAKKRELERCSTLVHWRMAQHRNPLPVPQLPIRVLVTRIAPRSLDAHDNLRAALKSVVDEIAGRYGLPDKDPRFIWDYDQERGAVREYAVRVEISEVRE